MSLDTPDFDSCADVIFAFDVGRQKTGIAIGNCLTGGARPLTVVRGGKTQQLDQINQQVQQWQPRRLIVGLPCHMDGSEHAMTRFSRQFADLLVARFHLPIHYLDERLTSIVARQQSSVDIDAVAATIILQSWLDSYPS